MATSINVNKLTVEGFLHTGSSTLFVIPEYQRPYSWRADIEVQILFDDLWEFTNRPLTDGGLGNVLERYRIVSDEIIAILKDWNN